MDLLYLGQKILQKHETLLVGIVKLKWEASDNIVKVCEARTPSVLKIMKLVING